MVKRESSDVSKNVESAVEKIAKEACANDGLDPMLMSSFIIPEFWRRYNSMKANRTACCRQKKYFEGILISFEILMNI